MAQSSQIWHHLLATTKLNNERTLTAFPPMRGTSKVGIITAVHAKDEMLEAQQNSPSCAIKQTRIFSTIKSLTT